MTAQVTMHQGQSVASTKMLCPISQQTKTKPPSIPSAKHHQNQFAKRAPARIAMPTTMGAIHAANPNSGFGNPNTLPCGESRFAVHCTSRL